MLVARKDEAMFLLKNKMLPKEKRVIRKDFDILIKDGKILHSPLFLFYFLERKDIKLGVVAPKKIFKKATHRNKYKRIVFNILKDLDFKKGSGFFVYKKGSDGAEKKEIEKDVIYLLKKSNLI